MDSQKFCLKWDNFQGSVTSLFDSLRLGDELVDITLCCEGQQVRAHRIMLSACSPYFREVLKSLPFQQTAFFLKDTSAEDLQAIVEFMYRGSVNVSQSQLAGFIRTAETLQIRGLSGDDDKPQQAKDPVTPGVAAAAAPPRAPPSPIARARPGRPPPSPAPPPELAPPRSPAAKRRRLSTVAQPAAAASASGSPQVIDCVSPEPDGPAPQQQHQQQPTSYDTPSQRPFQQVGASASPLPHPPPPPAQYSAAEQPSAGFEAAAAGSFDAQQLSAAAGDVKVEKVETFSGGEESDSLGAALDQVGEYDESSSTFGEEYPSMDMSAGSMGYNVQMGAAGSSERGAVGDDGSQQGPHVCTLCGKRYKNYSTLCDHKRKHDGATRCRLCGKVYGTVPVLRQHLRMLHGLSQQQMRELVPTRMSTNDLYRQQQ